jgi:chorismate mutase/prephenate dehydratase
MSQSGEKSGWKPSEVEDLKKYRQRIDEIDKTILELLIERASLAKRIGEIKKQKGLDIHVPEREREILERLLELNKGRFPEQALTRIFREIISACLSLEEPLKVGYLGPKATFTHQAALEHFGISAKYIALPTIRDVFEEVERENIDYGVVPVENTIEGVVNYTLDMFLSSPNAKIVGEIVIPVSQHLLSLATDLSQIKRVYSHPHALAQARPWLDKHLPHAQRIEVESTAKAAELALEDETAAAIASEAAAKVYNLNILAKNIQENINNYTRFWLSERNP